MLIIKFHKCEWIMNADGYCMREHQWIDHRIFLHIFAHSRAHTSHAHPKSATVVLANARSAFAQIFTGCDYYQPMDNNRWYDVFSPQYPIYYPVSSQCRWTGEAQPPNIITVNCTIMNVPTVSYTFFISICFRIKLVCIWLLLFSMLHCILFAVS